ncbi:hypothetical protein [Nocardia sp. NPDC052112]|uniref:hypothetical protein n=1 Tax=Nocardia sp. NPDC052112 TaxID=3155646 RepID=UPI00341CB43A
MTKYCLAITVTPTARGADVLACLRLAVTEAEWILDLDDPRADRGLTEVLGPCGEVPGMARHARWCRTTAPGGNAMSSGAPLMTESWLALVEPSSR